MHTVTNISRAPQGLHTTRGVVFVHPGKSRDVEFTKEGLAFAARLTNLLELKDLGGDPLDHDGDGHKGGSVSLENDGDLDKLREDYFKLFEKRAYHGWDAAELQAKIDAKLAE